MELIEERIERGIVLKLSGRFDAYAAPSVERFLKHIDMSTTPSVIIDFAHVNFVDSTGLATLIVGLKRCREHGASLMLCTVQQPVRIIFELTRLDKVFSIYESIAQAVAEAAHTDLSESELYNGI